MYCYTIYQKLLKPSKTNFVNKEMVYVPMFTTFLILIKTSVNNKIISMHTTSVFPNVCTAVFIEIILLCTEMLISTK